MPVIMSDSDATDIIEIFSSIQGEGLLVGCRQIFIRLYSCNLQCTYCDTLRDKPPEYCNIEKIPGRVDFEMLPNPISLKKIIALIDQWLMDYPAIHHSVSLTGGEPLLQADILKSLLPVIRKRLPIYLETSGILYEELHSLISYLDFISMDIKLPSTSGYGDLWEQHKEFLTVAVNKNVFVKTVVSNDTKNWEIIKACEIIAGIDNNIPLVMQPVTINNLKLGINYEKIYELQEIASRYLKEVRIIPQLHVFMGLK